MMHYVKYLSYVSRHKFWVMYYCFQEGMYWRGIMHDLNKFKLSSFIPYARYFYLKGGKGKFVRDNTGYYDASRTGDSNFDKAWKNHFQTNKHHWQHWVMPKDDGTFRCLDMPVVYVREMLCDFRGAGRAQGTNPTGGWEEVKKYYDKNRDKMHFSDDTRTVVEHLIIKACNDES